MENDLIPVIQSLISKGYDLRAISNTIGAPKSILNRILQGELINIDYCVKARLLFLYQHHNRPIHHV